MQKNVSFRYFLFSLILLFLSCLSVRAQSQDGQKEIFIQRIESIKTEPLEILPVSDCRLTDLESEIFLAYTYRNIHIPYDLQEILARKRRQIDFMRVHIDSLYYIQALQALNQTIPDWEAAEEKIEKSLAQNRFFVKSIVFKMTFLLVKKNNAQAVLRYMNLVLQECSSPRKIRQMSQASYDALLKGTQDLIDHKLYRDALDLCGLLETYCLPGFPIQYQAYKEKLLRNLAHQGIYRSYCEVAEKAFTQKQYQFSQKYAMQAFDYFNRFETHMNGVNHALVLLDRIAMQYRQIASASDPVEQAFYLALVDTIVDRTGLVISTGSELNPEQEIASELLALNRPEEMESETESKAKGEEPMLPADIFQTQNGSATPRLTPHQAQKQFEQACEQARYLNTKRQFAQAYALFEQAVDLKKQYRLRASTDFEQEVHSTLLQTVEQLVNKAVFRLWTNDVSQADELYSQANGLFEAYRQRESEDAATIARLQQLLDSYRQKRKENRCQDLSMRLNRMQTDFYRQASYGNYILASQDLEKFDSLYSRLGQTEFSTCVENSVSPENMRRLLDNWTRHKDSLRAAFALQQAGDTLAFIAKYQQASALFDSLGLGSQIPKEPSLFSRLSALGDLQTLLIWAESSVRNKDWSRARFLIGYLFQRNYRNDYLNKLSRPLRNAHE